MGLSRIKPNDKYTDGYEFSHGDCMVQYRTGGSGPQPLLGEVILKTANAILDDCMDMSGTSHGSFGTGNCDKCHVTINYRCCDFAK